MLVIILILTMILTKIACFNRLIINNNRYRTVVYNIKELLKSPEFDKEPDEVLISTELLQAEIPSPSFRETIESRQLAVSKVTGLFAITKNKCKHGYPQAFVQYPIGGGISSGMIRLSCPHLVKQVDTYENNGGIEYFNAILRDNDNEQGKILRNNFKDINLSWQRIRTKAINEKELDLLKKTVGEEKSSNLINSGIIGITLNKLDDVKCLHAHIADTLIRGESCNKIGSMALKKLEENGVDVRGCDNCFQQCDLSHIRTDDSYYYLPNKNKQKLRKSRINRILHKSRVKIAKNMKSKVNNNISDDDDITTI